MTVTELVHNLELLRDAASNGQAYLILSDAVKDLLEIEED